MSSIFDIINVPLGWIIKVCYQLTNNYLVALLLFAIALQLILSPFAIKQQKNSIKQAKLDPKVKAIRKKYAGRTDQATQQKMNNEVMELYQRENFNPMGGCLPLLIQMPILIALYNVVISPLKYICGFGSEVIANIQAKVYELMSSLNISGFESFAADKPVRQLDLIRKMRELGLDNFAEYGVTEEILPDFTVLGLDLSARPADQMWPLIIIPALTLVFTYAMQWITKRYAYNPNMGQQQDMSMKIMTWSMPLLSVYIAFTVEATIGCYWIFRNILSTIQTLILAKSMPIPRFTEEDYKAAEREMNVKEPKKKKSGDGTKKVRSLHRIDEDDYDDAGQLKPTEEKKPEIKESINEADAPKLKDESDRHKKDEPITEETNGEASE